jgi:hypothetical protein
MRCIYASECHSLQAPLAWACEEVSDPACPIEEGKAIVAPFSDRRFLAGGGLI